MEENLINPVFIKHSIMESGKFLLCIMLLLMLGVILVQAQTVTDIDGNVYNTVTIGTQVWMKENLKTTKYNDGTAIPNIADDNIWRYLTTGAYCDYENTPSNSTNYGRLYNWYVLDINPATKVASNGGRNVCPAGWHVSSDAEWTTLTAYLGGQSVAGGKLKETGTIHWQSPNEGATDEVGFTALPGGTRTEDALFLELGFGGFWWSSTEENIVVAFGRNLVSVGSSVDVLGYNKSNGWSVRCLKGDIPTHITNLSASIIDIYPNPVSGILNIDYEDEVFESVSILNYQGEFITKVTAIFPRQQLDFSRYKSGFYFLEFVKASGEVMKVKVINQ